MMDPNNAKQNKTFREDYRASQISQNYSGKLHLAITLSFAFSAIFLSVSQLSQLQPLEYLTIAVTFVYANLVEYFAHKGPMHRPFKGLDIIYKRHATQHHIFFTDQFMQFDSTRDFKAVLFPPMLIMLFLVFTALPTGLLVGWLFNPNVGYLFLITAFAYFATYEILHTSYHLPETHWINRLALFRRMKKLHQDHHRVDVMSHNNFNITFPIGDWLFGTLYQDESNEVVSVSKSIKGKVIAEQNK